MSIISTDQREIELPAFHRPDQFEFLSEIDRSVNNWKGDLAVDDSHTEPRHPRRTDDFADVVGEWLVIINQVIDEEMQGCSPADLTSNFMSAKIICSLAIYGAVMDKRLMQTIIRKAVSQDKNTKKRYDCWKNAFLPALIGQGLSDNYAEVRKAYCKAVEECYMPTDTLRSTDL